MADTPNKASGGANLTPRDMEILLAALRCLKSGPIEVDYQKLAPELGSKTDASARTSWHAVKKKLFASQPLAAATESAKTPKSKTPSKSKKPDAAKTPRSPTKKPTKSEVTLQHEPGVEDEPDVTYEDSPTDLQTPVTDTNGDTTMDDATPTEAEKGKAKATTPAPADDAPGERSPPPTPSPAAPTTPAKLVSKAKKKKATENSDILTTTSADADVDVAATPNTTAKPPAKKRSRKAKAEAAAEGEEVNGEGERPAKKPRKSPVKKSKEDGDVETVGASPATPKLKAPRKPRAAAKAKAPKEAAITAENFANEAIPEAERLRKDHDAAMVDVQNEQVKVQATEANDNMTGKKKIDNSGKSKTPIPAGEKEKVEAINFIIEIPNLENDQAGTTEGKALTIGNTAATMTTDAKMEDAETAIVVTTDESKNTNRKHVTGLKVGQKAHDNSIAVASAEETNIED